MKQQFFVTHTVHQNEIPTLLDGWVTNTPSVESTENSFSLYFCKNIICVSVGLLSRSKVFFSHL